jgi:osmotically-inducible protein OsmY
MYHEPAWGLGCVVMRKVIRNLDLILCLALTILLTSCAGRPTQESTGEYVDDTLITTRIKSKLLDDWILKGFAIKVETFKGVVRLSGFVDTMEQAQRAVEVTRSVVAVKLVKNSLMLKSIY